LSGQREAIARIRSVSGRVWDVVAVDGDILQVRGELLSFEVDMTDAIRLGVSLCESLDPDLTRKWQRELEKLEQDAFPQGRMPEAGDA